MRCIVKFIFLALLAGQKAIALSKFFKVDDSTLFPLVGARSSADAESTPSFPSIVTNAGSADMMSSGEPPMYPRFDAVSSRNRPTTQSDNDAWLTKGVQPTPPDNLGSHLSDRAAFGQLPAATGLGGLSPSSSDAWRTAPELLPINETGNVVFREGSSVPPAFVANNFQTAPRMLQNQPFQMLSPMQFPGSAPFVYQQQYAAYQPVLGIAPAAAAGQAVALARGFQVDTPTASASALSVTGAHDMVEVPVDCTSAPFMTSCTKDGMRSTLSAMIQLTLVVLVAHYWRTHKVELFAHQDKEEELKASPDAFEDWRFSLFGCLEDVNTCVCGCCCPAILWSETISRVPGLLTFWVAFVAFVGLQFGTQIVIYLVGGTSGFFGLLFLVLLVYYRQQMRRKFKMENTPVKVVLDVATYCCCSCCAIIQEARHVREAIESGHHMHEPVAL